MMLKLADTSQKVIILGIFILDKVTCLRALLDPPPPRGWCLGIYRSVPLDPELSSHQSGVEQCSPFASENLETPSVARALTRASHEDLETEIWFH